MVTRSSTAAMSTKLIDITKQLKSFLNTTASSTLLKETNGISGISIIEAHVQKRRLDTDRAGGFLLRESSANDTNCINIVNVAVSERNRRKGLFTDFLELLERFDYGPCLKNGSDFHVRVDNVMNPVLDEFLPKKGYSRIRSGNDPHYSYLKIVRQGKEQGVESSGSIHENQFQDDAICLQDTPGMCPGH
ncbi:MAG: hypothetical protein VB050_04805 [Geobacteraceae bacterium]|nr:hypothetical protein [Geobacteraceae bacterium]